METIKLRDNGVENVDKKCAIGLSTIGLQAYKLLSSLVAPLSSFW